MSLSDYVPEKYIPLFSDPEFLEVVEMHAYELMSPSTFEILKRMGVRYL
jgi:hypothetical protein